MAESKMKVEDDIYEINESSLLFIIHKYEMNPLYFSKNKSTKTHNWKGDTGTYLGTHKCYCVIPVTYLSISFLTNTTHLKLLFSVLYASVYLKNRIYTQLISPNSKIKIPTYL
jgi:hypothetical protein